MNQLANIESDVESLKQQIEQIKLELQPSKTLIPDELQKYSAANMVANMGSKEETSLVGEKLKYILNKMNDVSKRGFKGMHLYSVVSPGRKESLNDLNKVEMKVLKESLMALGYYVSKPSFFEWLLMDASIVVYWQTPPSKKSWWKRIF